jgi:hypothetical protein
LHLDPREISIAHKITPLSQISHCKCFFISFAISGSVENVQNKDNYSLNNLSKGIWLKKIFDRAAISGSVENVQ